MNRFSVGWMWIERSRQQWKEMQSVVSLHWINWKDNNHNHFSKKEGRLGSTLFWWLSVSFFTLWNHYQLLNCSCKTCHPRVFKIDAEKTDSWMVDISMVCLDIILDTPLISSWVWIEWSFIRSKCLTWNYLETPEVFFLFLLDVISYCSTDVLLDFSMGRS